MKSLLTAAIALLIPVTASAFDTEAAKDIPHDHDTMQVVHIDPKQAVMIDKTFGIKTEGSVKTALVVFAYNPQYLPPNSTVVAESGRVSVDCEKKLYRLLSDNTVDGQGRVVNQKTDLKKDWIEVKEQTINETVYNYVCLNKVNISNPKAVTEL